MGLASSGHYIHVTTPGFVAAHSFAMTESSELALAAFEMVLERERGRLFAIAFTILRDPTEAEDVVQDAAAAAWRGWESRTEPAQTSAWLTTICVRKSLRHRSRLFRGLLLDSALREELARADHALHSDGRYLDLHRAHGQLSKQQRAVVSLHYQYGYTLADCARLMGCSTGAVSSHLSRALARLRKELTDE
jgi:RNA polymerase sigma-70 factor (ECF subfamily)